MRPNRVLVLAALGLFAAGASDAGGSRPFARPGGVGPVCGDPAIVGDVIPNIDGPGGCGVSGAVRVHSVSGVALAPQPTITCGTARALNAWVVRGAKPEIARLRERLVGLDLAAHYSCRNRNNARAGRLSEHARGRAVDIAAFRLADGRTVTVAADWQGREYGAALRRIHAAGCGPFKTTLGPGADALHHDHFHLDIERRRGSTYCR